MNVHEDIRRLTATMVDFMPEILETGLLWLLFAVLLRASLGVKRSIVRPMLERHYKKVFMYERKLRRRQLRDTLNDPLLSRTTKEEYLKAMDGDIQRVEEAMRTFRAKAESDVFDEEGTKGQEKIMVLIKIRLFSVTMILGIFPIVYLNLLCAESSEGEFVYTMTAQVVIFFYINAVDHARMFRAMKPQGEKVERPSESVDVEQPVQVL